MGGDNLMQYHRHPLFPLQWYLVWVEGDGDMCDALTAQLLLPLGSLLTCLFVDWYVPRKLVREQFTNWETVSGRFFCLFIFAVRFICPVGIVLIFLNQIGVI